jgi:hypothetical protein
VDNVLVCVLHKQAVKKVKILYSFLKILCFADSAHDEFILAIFYIYISSLQFVTGVSSESMLFF